MRVCSEPGCPTLIPAGTRGGRCPTHTRARDRARGTATQRGYGTAHQKLRRSWQTRIDSGEPVTCWRCGTPIRPGDTWDLGHADHDRTRTNGPECQPCNRATSTRRISPDA